MGSKKTALNKIKQEQKLMDLLIDAIKKQRNSLQSNIYSGDIAW